MTYLWLGRESFTYASSAFVASLEDAQHRSHRVAFLKLFVDGLLVFLAHHAVGLMHGSVTPDLWR